MSNANNEDKFLLSNVQRVQMQSANVVGPITSVNHAAGNLYPSLVYLPQAPLPLSPPVATSVAPAVPVPYGGVVPPMLSNARSDRENNQRSLSAVLCIFGCCSALASYHPLFAAMAYAALLVNFVLHVRSPYAMPKRLALMSLAVAMFMFLFHLAVLGLLIGFLSGMSTGRRRRRH